MTKQDPLAKSLLLAQTNETQRSSPSTGPCSKHQALHGLATLLLKLNAGRHGQRSLKHSKLQPGAPTVFSLGACTVQLGVFTQLLFLQLQVSVLLLTSVAAGAWPAAGRVLEASETQHCMEGPALFDPQGVVTLKVSSLNAPGRALSREPQTGSSWLPFIRWSSSEVRRGS